MTLYIIRLYIIRLYRHDVIYNKGDYIGMMLYIIGLYRVVIYNNGGYIGMMLYRYDVIYNTECVYMHGVVI